MTRRLAHALPSPRRSAQPKRAAPRPPRAAARRAALARLATVVGLAALVAGGCTCSKGQDVENSRSAAKIERVASQTILSDEVLWALGDEVRPRVVALSPLVDDPRYSTIVERWPAAIPRLAGSSEALLARAPQLVIIASFTAPETRAFLDAHGVETLSLDAFRGFDDLWRHTRAIAAAVDAEAAGERLIAAQQAELAALEAAVADGPRPAALSWGEGFVAGADTTFDGVARYAGLDNLAARRGITGHAPLTAEALVALDPQVIVIGCEPPRCAEAEAEFAARPGIAATRAAREHGIFAVPAALLASTGAGMIDAARTLGERRAALLAEAPRP
ncbi:MAG: ABC transporter substrate-binding protein [Nannocystaceae bacterium]